MADTLVIAEQPDENAGRRFSWGLAIAGGTAATATTFFLLSLGSGFGLLLANPVTHAGPSAPTFMTGGAIYFFIAQAFGFAVGGHLAGRLLGPQIESRVQEEFRAAAHGLVAWAVTILATLTMLALAGLTVASTGAMFDGGKHRRDDSGALWRVILKEQRRDACGLFRGYSLPPRTERGSNDRAAATSAATRNACGRI